MKVKIMILIVASLLLSSCGNEKKNPLLEKWDTPFGTPPFDEIKNEHYLPAFNEAIKAHNEEIRKIINLSDEISKRSALSLICESDSSPETYSVILPDFALCVGGNETYVRQECLTYRKVGRTFLSVKYFMVLRPCIWLV